MFSVLAVLGITLSVLALLALAGLAYVTIRYVPIVGRVFEQPPMFNPLRVPPTPGGEDVDFEAADGTPLKGTYFRTKAQSRLGVVVFCHEYLSDRWSFAHYAAWLLDSGYDLFTFDFRHHGESGEDKDYSPLQWVTRHEVRDLRGALRYLRSRPDRDPAGFLLFGVSRGGGTAICAAAKDPTIWGVVTDGAFPTRGTMLAYIDRWAHIFAASRFMVESIPRWVYAYLGWAARFRSQWRLGCRYSNVDGAVARIAPRPWLSIHGEKDNYITADIAREFAARAGDPKEFWLVPAAKHNGCVDVDPAAYRGRILSWLRRSAPRTSPEAPPTVAPAVALKTLPQNVAGLVPISG